MSAAARCARVCRWLSRPRVDRYRLGRTSPEGFYRDSYDYARLFESLLTPFAPGGSGRFRVAVFDHRADVPVAAPEQQADADAALILDGIFLHRPQLRANWDFSIFLHVSFGVPVARCSRRDGWSPDPHAVGNRRYVEGQRLYLRDALPWEHATVILDTRSGGACRLHQPGRPGHVTVVRSRQRQVIGQPTDEPPGVSGELPCLM